MLCWKNCLMSCYNKKFLRRITPCTLPIGLVRTFPICSSVRLKSGRLLAQKSALWLRWCFCDLLNTWLKYKMQTTAQWLATCNRAISRPSYSHYYPVYHGVLWYILFHSNIEQRRLTISIYRHQQLCCLDFLYFMISFKLFCDFL